MSKKILPVSVVIPTLGGGQLINTVTKLNNGEFVPAEILVCIPKEFNMDFNLPSNTVLIITPEKGQVFQRALGFKNSIQPFVLQLDDDVELASDSFKMLYDKLTSLGVHNAVAPIWIDSITQNAVHKYKSGLISIFENMIIYFVIGAPWGIKRMGTVSKSGVNYGVDKNFMKDELLRVDWLPGGCVMYYKQDLYCENYYPFQGKAFSEDLIHSFILRNNGVNLFVVRDSIALTPIPVNKYDSNEFSLKYKALKYFNNLQSGSRIRLFLWGLISKIRRV